MGGVVHPYGAYFAKKQDQEQRACDGQMVETKNGERAERRMQPAVRPALRSHDGVLVDASASPHTQQEQAEKDERSFPLSPSRLHPSSGKCCVWNAGKLPIYEGSASW